ncbi:MAG: prolyl oligopeptidase family serine peptidase, partial [Myxococcota bacterium]
MAAPPIAKRVPHELQAHGVTRVDPYHWLRDPAYPEVTDPEIRAYLEAENAYLEASLDAGVRATLEAELKARIAENDDGVPYRKRGFWYWHRWLEGKQYPVHLRAPDAGGAPGDEEVLLDENARAAGHEYLSVAALAVAPDDGRLAFSEDVDGSERYVIRVRELAGGALLSDAIPNTAGGVVWGASGEHLFYARLDAQLRPQAILRHRLGTDAADDAVIYEEKDARMWLGLGKTSDERYLVVSSRDKESAEVHLLDLRDPEGSLRRVLARREGHLYDVDHHPSLGAPGARLLIRTNDRHRNYRLVHADPEALGSDAEWVEHVAPSDEVYLLGSVLLEGHLVHYEREAGLPHLRVEPLDGRASWRVDVPEPVYVIRPGANAEMASTTLRIGYQSLTTPATVIDVDLESRAQVVLKVQRIPSGYDASEYESRRLFAMAKDGTRVPISVVKRKDTEAGPETPLQLYAYGAYGHSLDASFSAARKSLLDRGFICAIAHVRGGGELGRAWYDAGKLEKKENTFTDTLA